MGLSTKVTAQMQHVLVARAHLIVIEL